MTPYDVARAELKAEPKKWLVTGVAGFIGSNLLEELLKLGQFVVGMDNFSTGKPANLTAVETSVSRAQWQRFSFLEGDITDETTCRKACNGVQVVLHQAALGSVPRSLAEPVRYHATNVTGFLNVLVAARDAEVQRFVFASSSSVYGDNAEMPKIEGKIGHALSPYAASKRINEIYAEAFARSYGFSSIGLRYFNVFGPRQDPTGAYAAVIPRWMAALLQGQRVHIHGDGETSRDFCFIDNVTQANILAGTINNPEAINQLYNIAAGERTTLDELFALLKNGLRTIGFRRRFAQPLYGPFRPGDVRHSLADIGKAKRLLGYSPANRVADGLNQTILWYERNLRKRTARPNPPAQGNAR